MFPLLFLLWLLLLIIRRRSIFSKSLCRNSLFLPQDAEICVSPAFVPGCGVSPYPSSGVSGFPLVQKADVFRFFEEKRFYLAGLSLEPAEEAGGCRNQRGAWRFVPVSSPLVLEEIRSNI